MSYLSLAKLLTGKIEFVPYSRLTEREKYYADDNVVEKYQSTHAQKAQIINLWPGKEDITRRDLMTETTRKKLTWSERQEERKRLAKHIAVDYPHLSHLPTNQIIKYKEAVDTYPDLAELGISRLVILAYEFRKEQIREYHEDHTTELANARCNLQIGGYKNIKIPKDLPQLSFEKECVVCHIEEKVISICPKCWQNIRKCLELKGKSHREGWEGWGYEMNLDLEPLIKMLKKSEKENNSESSGGASGIK